MAALALIWPFLRPLVPYLLCAAALGGAYLYADHGWHNAVAKHAEARAVAAESKLAELDKQRIAQQERWTQVTAAEELKARNADAKRKGLFAGRADAARRDPAAVAVRVPESVRRMLGDAYAAAKAAEAPAEPTAAAPAHSATVADTTAWGIQMLEWAALCRDRVSAWQDFYRGLQNGQGN